jgi:general stress protein YciG
MAQNDNQQGARGFAAMDPEEQRDIASRGGKAAHEKGTAHQFNSDEAREAGAKGGKARQGNRANEGGEGGGVEGTEEII